MFGNVDVMRRRYNLPFNEVIPLNEEKFDVSDLTSRHKICYYPERDIVVLKSGYIAVKADTRLKELGDFVELSKADAPQKFPEKFIDTAIGERYDSSKTYTAGIQLNAAQMLFCRRHGDVATYIRGLIDKEMQAEGANEL